MKTIRNAGAVDYSDEEKNKIIQEKISKGKKSLIKMNPSEDIRKLKLAPLMKLFIEAQKKYRIAIKSRFLKQCELEELQKQEETGNITVQWFSTPMPLKLLSATISLEKEYYVEKVMLEENYKNDLLKKWKLSKKDLGTILDGNYVKDLKINDRQIDELISYFKI